MSNILVTVMAYDAEKGGGGVRLAYELACGLASRGHKVTVVCEDLFDRGLEYEVLNGVTILRYKLSRTSSVNFRRYNEHIKSAEDLLVKYVDNPPEIIHGHNILQYIGACNVFKNKVKRCYTIHSPALDELRITWGGQGISGGVKCLFGLPVIRKLELGILNESDLLTAESNFTVNLIKKDYGTVIANRIKVIPGWVNINKYRPIPVDCIEEARKKFKWPIDTPVLFVLRRLESRMGLENLLLALALIKKQGVCLFTAIGGSGSLRFSLERLRNRLNLNNAVNFMGFIPDICLPLAYGACDVSLIPTAQLECFGIIALEALACGKVTLVTPVGALPEVMNNFEKKWIARGSSAQDIADLLLLYLNKELPLALPKDIRLTIKNRYSFDSALSKYESILTGKL